MNGTKWLILVAIAAIVLQKVVQSNEEKGAVVQERDVDDDIKARNVVDQLAEIPDTDEDGMEKRTVQKRLFIRARRVLRRIIRRVFRGK